MQPQTHHQPQRAMWYRVVIQVGAVAIDVTLSDADEVRVTDAISRTGEPFQVWVQRHDGSVESLTVVPGNGVRHNARAARPIPIITDGSGRIRPAAQGEQPNGEIAPTDTRYPELARPALVRELPYPAVAVDDETHTLLRRLVSVMSASAQPRAASTTPVGPPVPSPAEAESAPPSMPQGSPPKASRGRKTPEAA